MKTDDPKLTAYALGELSTAECAEIEASLRDDTALATEIEATRNFASQLRSELQAEAGDPLSPMQRSKILAIVRSTQGPIENAGQGLSRKTMFGAAAAALLIAGFVFGLLLPSIRFEQEMAKKSALSRLAPERFDLPVQDAAEPRNLNLSIGAVGRPENRADMVAADPTRSVALDREISVGLPVSRSFAVGNWDHPRTYTPFDFGEAEATGFADVSAAQPEQTATSAQPSDPSSGLATITAKSGTGALVAREKVELGVSLGDMERRTVARATPASIAPAAESRVASGVQRPELQMAQVGGGFSIRSGPELVLAESDGVPAASQNRYSGRTSITPPVAAAAAPADVRLELVKQQQEQARKYFHPPGEPDDFGAERAYRLRQQPGNTEAYDPITDNAFLPVKDNPLSTFSIDVDTASYANVRRFLTSGALPPKGAVRIEEMLNYFTYDYPQPAGDAPFSATMDVAACPWTPEHRLVRIGFKGRDLARSERPNANLVFLIDVSGSMNEPNKLPLVKESLRLLVDQLDDRDQVAIAVYAGASGTVLEPTRDKAQMRAALDRLQAGGSTNGAGGIQLAYELAARSFIKGGTNRVILATDGDFNVGITDQGALVELITTKAKSGVFLSVLGYGMGNLKDSTLEKLADKGNGNYGYIDTLAEAKKTLVQQMNGTLYTIAKDVKIQVEFNPAQASAYRLIGYENRLLAKEDFNDDKKDAGEIGAGHMVTALYEVVPVGGAMPAVLPLVDALKYTAESAANPAAKPEAIVGGKLSGSAEMLTLKLRYKKPDGDISQKLEFPLTDRGETWEKSAQDFRWAAAVASFGMLLRDSPHKGGTTWDATLEMAREGKGDDSTGYRVECLALMERAKSIWAGVAR